MTRVPVIETPAIETRQLSIQFGGHIAVNCLDLKVAPHCLKSIIGPNGAGKTTLFNLISGQYTPTSGNILFNGRDITRMGVADRTRLGIGRSFQLTNIFPSLTVLENVRLALQAKENVGMVFWRHYKAYPKLSEHAYELLKQVMLADKHRFMASLLTHGEQRKLEIAILLALDPDVLLLDEPTAGMSLEDVPAILDIIQGIKETKTRTILLVEHKFDMIMALSDSIAVLQEGRVICDDTPDAVSNNEKVLEAYLGGGVTHA
ncbi:MAG: ABC transporter ATP-binding protein [Deltaproteobacteria bacterium]|uniref:ABC transporter ATP-binding protein n=1 Tax=Desulfobacula sp. TaxID=2593537 RepID=UPI0019847E39|nr:ABC transporter ATP-binding protein [Candidatus Desulfobacula maris]MBL6993924.1 ABC transporter ATP-binding protein [Desulfobacula sp.]